MNLRTNDDDWFEFKPIASFDLTRPRQRGVAFLPLLAANWQLVAIGLLVAAAGAYALHCEHVKKDHATFIAKLEAQAEEQVRQNKIKELANEKRIQGALSERDLARKRLRSQPRPLDLSSSPTAPTGSSEVCFGAAGYNAAFSEYRESLGRSLEEIRGIAIQCAEAQIDVRAWRDSWHTADNRHNWQFSSRRPSCRNTNGNV